MEQRQKDKVAAMRQQAAAGSVAEKVKQVLLPASLFRLC